VSPVAVAVNITDFKGVETMHISDAEANLIVTHEGYRANWYQDISGHWTIGCGYMNDNKQLPAGYPYTPPLSRGAAIALIYYIIGNYENTVKNTFPSKTFTQYQFDALVDHAYGWGSFGTSLKNAINDNLTGDALKNVFYLYDHAMVDGQLVEIPYLKKILYTQYHLYTTGSYAFVAEGDVAPPPNPTPTGLILAAYSSDGITWHNMQTPKDTLKRISLDNGATWTPIAIKYKNKSPFIISLLKGR
jgi:GH24 family phage-related lysozyme (muramidase)